MLWELKSRCIFAQAMTPKQKQNIMTYEITTKFIATLTDQLQNTFMPKQVALLVQKEIDRLESLLQTI